MRWEYLTASVLYTLHSIYFQKPAKNLKSGVNSRGELKLGGGKSPLSQGSA